MSKYKRLTNKDWKEHYDIFEDVCCDTCREDCGACERNFNALVRLAELEDKIQNGTLVELPCKAGDTVYFDTYRHGKSIGVQPHKVERVDVVVITERIFGNVGADIPEWQFGKSVFLTKSEAETRLKELQAERKDES